MPQRGVGNSVGIPRINPPLFSLVDFRACLVYNHSTKVGDIMRQFEMLDALLDERDGIIKTSEALALGISKEVFYRYVDARALQQAAHGVFVSPNAWLDSMYLIHLRSDQAVFSHETALFLHDLTDREPVRYSITVKAGYNAAKFKADGISVYSVKKELHHIGVTTLPTPFGHEVLAYDMERTICDLVRSRRNIDVQVFTGALKQYVRRPDMNLNRLMEYAPQFRIDKVLRKYLEVLL